MNYILAVSGGIDSVVLLDLMARTQKRIIVAHFDHGIRGDSAADARFVEALATVRYGAVCIRKREELGVDASEELARERRYSFLCSVAAEYKGVIVTAHHRDDIIETIAMNLQRGTRWRGVAGMSAGHILRPLNNWTKQQIYMYAVQHALEWCEDETNNSSRYARNVIRQRVRDALSEEEKAAIYTLWRKQRAVRRDIERELWRFEGRALNRYFLAGIEEAIAMELVYEYVLRHTNVSLLTSQLERVLVAIKTGRPGTTWQIGGGVVMKLTARGGIIDGVD